MAAIADSDLLDYFAAIVRKASRAALVPQWTTMATRANSQAWNDIVALLAQNGYTLAQITAADQAADWNYRQGIYWMLTDGAAIENTGYQPDQIDKFNIVKKLAGSIVLTSGGVIVTPTGPIGQAATGFLSGESDQAMRRREWNDQPSWAHCWD